MLTSGQQLMVVLLMAAAIAVAACTSGRRDSTPAERPVDGADTVTLAVEGMT